MWNDFNDIWSEKSNEQTNTHTHTHTHTTMSKKKEIRRYAWFVYFNKLKTRILL